MYLESAFLSFSSSRRKAEEDRIRKEEEKARRELIKQEYLRRKQQALMEEQGLVKPRPWAKSGRSRPKSLHRVESNSLTKGSTTRNPQTVFHMHFVGCLHNHNCFGDVSCLCSLGCAHLSECARVYYAGNSLTVSMLTKTKCSAANSREGEPSNLLCMTLPKRILLLSRQRNGSFIDLGYLRLYKKFKSLI